MIRGSFRDKEESLHLEERKNKVMRDELRKDFGKKWIEKLIDSEGQHFESNGELFREHEDESSRMDRISFISSKEAQHIDNESVFSHNTSEKHYNTENINVMKKDGYHTRISLGMQ
ncbi:hypothetical protein KIN20_013684 [Parelaphostrongylus tenuis]|uniref:Uncharacterized protein n=1 Tax=Parelaphostrongylus tenuis TaxID=148309 RepID=A0AAD5MDX9_PARTN|nr:hypothetical protein KIN20_013684 [Parelaphostrongylus tenuis]